VSFLFITLNISYIIVASEREHAPQQQPILDQTHQSSQQQQLQAHQLQQLMQAPAEYSGNPGNLVNTEQLLSMTPNNFNQLNTESAPQFINETELLALLQQYHSLQSYPNTSLHNTWT
jgi:hypothetical protein